MLTIKTEGYSDFVLQRKRKDSHQTHQLPTFHNQSCRSNSVYGQNRHLATPRTNHWLDQPSLPSFIVEPSNSQHGKEVVHLSMEKSPCEIGCSLRTSVIDFYPLF